MLRQARKNGITLDELFSTSYPSNKQTPAQKIISMYSERRGGSKYKPKRSRAPNRSKPRKRSKCAKFSKSMCNNNSKKTRGCVWRKNTGCVRKSRRSGRRSGRKSRKPVRNSQKTSGCGCLGVRCLSKLPCSKGWKYDKQNPFAVPWRRPKSRGRRSGRRSGRKSRKSRGRRSGRRSGHKSRGKSRSNRKFKILTTVEQKKQKSQKAKKTNFVRNVVLVHRNVVSKHQIQRERKF